MKEREFEDQDEFDMFSSEEPSDQEHDQSDHNQEITIHFCASCSETYRDDHLPDDSDFRCPECDERLKEVGPESILEETIQIQNLSVPVFFENRYRLIETVGAGGSGYIFKARDLELDRVCAMKLTSTLNAREEDLERFEREARLTARLNHENIIDITDYGRSENTAYYSMTYLDGESLHELLQDAEIPTGAALKIIRNAALALHHAHLNSIIHRDIKPHNIMIVPREEFITDETSTDMDTSLTLTSGELANEYRVVLMDFGLGKSLEQNKQLTRTGQIFGTPHYMSPEQAQGITGRINERSDIYSLGVVLYQLLSGKLPFESDSVNQLLKQIREEDPTPLKSRKEHMDDDLHAIVHKAIRKEQNRRYETALDFAQDCERALRGEPVQAREPGLWYHFRKAVKRHRTAVGVAAAIVLAVTTVLGWMEYDRYTTYRNQIQEARSHLKEEHPEKADQALDVAARQYETVQINELRRKVVNLNKQKKAREQFRKGKRLLNEAETKSKQKKRLSAFEQARSVLESAARTYPDQVPSQWKKPLEEVRRNVYTIAFDRVRTEVELVQEVTEEIDRREQKQIPFTEPFGTYENLYEKAKENIQKLKVFNTADTWWAAGHVARRMGFSGKAEKYYRKALELNERHRLALVGLATDQIENELLKYFLDRKGNQQKAAKLHIENALEQLQKASRKGQSDRYETLAGKQFRKTIRHRLQVGHLYELLVKEKYDTLIEKIDRMLTENYYWEYHLLAGFAYAERDGWEAARRQFLRAKKARPGSARVLSWYAMAQPETKKKIALLTRAINLHPRDRRAWFLRGIQHRSIGNNKQAIRDYSKAIELSPEFPEAFVNRGMVKSKQNRYKEALSDFNRALELAPEFAEAYYNRGNARRAHDKLKKAVQDYTRAIEIDPEFPRAFLNRGNANVAMDKPEKAIKDFTRVIQLNPYSETAYMNRGNVKAKLGRYNEALADFSKAIELNSDYAEAYFNRGTAQFKQGNYDKAIDDFTRTIELNPRHWKAFMNRGAAKYQGLGYLRKALNDYRRVLKMVPDDSRVNKKVKSIIQQIQTQLQKKNY